MRYTSIRPFIFLLPPELAHRAGITALKWGALRSVPTPPESLRINAFGLTFPSPIGMAAGFDKNAEVAPELLKLGFGFVEAGTVTPRAQAGNPRPRLFRLVEDEALINRLGFNNAGMTAFAHNAKRERKGILGINIGKNKDSADAKADYLQLYENLAPLADYITVNVSSPNTPGLRGLQEKQPLKELLAALAKVKRGPILLKIAPDLEEYALDDIAEVALTSGIDGLIISNTTISRPELLQNRNKKQSGGLSGKPLLSLSNQVLAAMYQRVGKKLPLIGVGGVASAEDAYQKIRHGATLVQLYTAFIYQGFGLLADIYAELPELLKRDGFDSVKEAVGTGVSP